MNEEFPRTGSQLDNLIDEVASGLANPPLPASLEARLRLIAQPVPDRSSAMTANNVIAFNTFDRMKGGRSSRTTVAWAAFAHAAALLLILTQVRAIHTAATHMMTVATLEAPPVKTPPKAVLAGGGGGQQGPVPVSHGAPPRFSPQQLSPPKALVQDPKLAVAPSVDVDPRLMAKSDMPNIGMMNSPLVGVSMGNGNGSGLGSGNGNGVGPGAGGNIGGGLRRIGGGVSAPIVLFAPEPEFSEEARKAKAAGNVLVYLQVDTNGHPTHVRVIRGIGLGLDEKAMEAVRKYRFSPAMENGHPVAVEMNVEVNFQIF